MMPQAVQLSMQSPFLAVLTSGSFWIAVAIIAAAYSIFTLGLQANVMFTGVFNFGQAGFMAVAAYSMAILILRFHWNPLAALAAAVALSVLTGLLVGLPSVRLARDYFAMLTLAVAELIQSIGQNGGSFTGGNTGLNGFDSTWDSFVAWVLAHASPFGLATQTQWPLAVLSWLVFALFLALTLYLRRTPWGRVARAIVEDETAVAATGKNVYVYKLQSITLGAVLAAVAGFIVALNLTVVYPVEFSADFTFIGFAILALGGFGSFGGVAIGSVLLWVVMEWVTLVPLPLSADRVAAIQMLIVGAILVAFMAWRPQGLFGRRGEMMRSE